MEKTIDADILIILCMPVKGFPELAVKGSLQEHCSECNDLIWVSKKKKNMLKNKGERFTDVVYLCPFCAAAKTNGFKNVEDFINLK